MRARAVNRRMMRRAWAMGAAPVPGRLTIDPDATSVDTYGKAKEAPRSSLQGRGAARAAGRRRLRDRRHAGSVPGAATPARGASSPPSSTERGVASIPAEAWPRYELWIHIDWAGLSNKVVETCCGPQGDLHHHRRAERSRCMRPSVRFGRTRRRAGLPPQTPTASSPAPRSPRPPTPSRVVTCASSCALSERRPASS